MTDASDRPSDADGDPLPNLDADIGPNQEGGAQGGDAADAAAVPDNPTQTATHVAVIGDYGLDGPDEAAVARVVRSFGPDAILTVGDNNYYSGEQATIDANIGKYFSDFIAPYFGEYGPGAGHNRFYPSLGNHDWYAPGALPYLSYFTLPGNERYYDFVWGHVHFFAIDSDYNEPDGISPDSIQAQWLKQKLVSSAAPWKVVFFHEPPYSSGTTHGSNFSMRWPFREWGADLVLNGHNHIYERLEVDGLPYVINGLGGGPIQGMSATPVPGTMSRYNESHGAGFIDANAKVLVSRFVTVDFERIDELILTKAVKP